MGISGIYQAVRRTRLFGGACRDEGMSLVEVLVAAALLGGCLLSLCTLFIFGIKNNMAAKHDTLMAAYSQDKMEWLKQQQLPYLYNLRESNGTAKDFFVGGVWKSEAELAAEDDILYRREWEVNDKTLLTTEFNKNAGDFNNTVLEITIRCYAYKYLKGEDQRMLEIRTFRRAA